jgi:hypothetical protein
MRTHPTNHTKSIFWWKASPAFTTSDLRSAFYDVPVSTTVHSWRYSEHWAENWKVQVSRQKLTFYRCAIATLPRTTEKTAIFSSVRIDGVPAEIRTVYHYTNLLGAYLWDSSVYSNNELWCSENKRKSRNRVADFDSSPWLSANKRYMLLVDPHQRRDSIVIVNTQHNCTSHWTRFITLCTGIQVRHSNGGPLCVTLSPPRFQLTLRRTNPGRQVTVVTKRCRKA